MTTLRSILVVWLAAIGAAPSHAQPAPSDSQAIVQFQRALDVYAFEHRKVERRAGETPDQSAIAGAIRATRPSVEGAMFTPLVAAALRARIVAALRTGCAPPQPGDSFIVPRVNEAAGAAVPIGGCLAAALPRLPVELEYRARGVTLILVDTHANLVVDVLHAAFPPPNGG